MAAPMDKLFVREFNKKNGKILHINQCEVGDVGCVVWDAALVLSYFLETDYFSELCVKNVDKLRAVELGAGTGIVGIQAACLGLSCLITDLPEFVPLINLNIQANKEHLHGSATCIAKSLTWGDEEDIKACCTPEPDVVLLADCIYYGESIEPLVTTIRKLSSPKTVILCCYEERTTGNKPLLQKRFFELMGEHFEVDKVPLEKQDPVFRSEDIHIMIFKKNS